MDSAVVIGAGRLGQTLGALLGGARYRRCYYTKRTAARVSEVSGFLHRQTGYVFDDRDLAASKEFLSFLESEGPGLLAISVADDALEGVANALANVRDDWTGTTVFHLSGAQPVEVLSRFSAKGGNVGVLHPCYPFFSPLKKLPTNPSVFFTFSGDPAAESVLGELVEGWGGEFSVIKLGSRVAYHAGCVFSAGHLVTLLANADSLLQSSGLSEGEARRVVGSIASGVFRNLFSVEKDTSYRQALTGPFARGDSKTVAKHLSSIENLAPELVELYKILGEKSGQL